MRHFLDLLDLTPDEIVHLFQEAARLKAAHARREPTPVLLGRVLGLVFEKPSMRTRVSFQAAMAQLGGTSVFLSGNEVGLGSRESVPDFARTMCQYVDAVVLRTFSHQTVETFARHATCPVINGLSDYYHPCQALADLFTMHETFGCLKGRTLVFVGDGNNVARSVAVCCGKLGVRFILAAPPGYGFDGPFLEAYHRIVPNGTLQMNGVPQHAVGQADVIYTDVWTSMGQEAEREQRLQQFAPFQVNEALLALAPAHARLMHCLPAHRGEEVTNEVLDGERSIVFEQAGNRMHAQKALLQWLLA
ncbi:MAG: ornithine carbamoyltransferase [Gemmataceae bacterium]|nr:ornithine carbamoyltransferase [Gemmataceae bacterium]